eukprot:symbB.v1.2.004059.t1/scaffold229.1/size262426/2
MWSGGPSSCWSRKTLRRTPGSSPSSRASAVLLLGVIYGLSIGHHCIDLFAGEGSTDLLEELFPLQLSSVSRLFECRAGDLGNGLCGPCLRGQLYQSLFHPGH